MILSLFIFLWLDTSKGVNMNLVPNTNAKYNLLSLSEISRPKISTFWSYVHLLMYKIVANTNNKESYDDIK